MNDNYSHLDDKLIYTSENIPGPYSDEEEYEILLNNFNVQFTDHCNCNEDCNNLECFCFKQKSANYVKYSQNGEIKFKLINCDISDNMCPIVECNSLCKCTFNCGNRVVQHGPINNLFVNVCHKTNKGLGLYTKNFIRRGTFICEYAGEVITKTQAVMRHKRNLLKGNMNYIFCLNEHSSGNVIQTFVDPGEIGNIGRYINHSCEPNCKIIPVRVNNPIPKLAIFSCKDIDVGEEITFSYGFCKVIPAENVVQKKCLCNSKNCNGLLPFQVY